MEHRHVHSSVWQSELVTDRVVGWCLSAFPHVHQKRVMNFAPEKPGAEKKRAWQGEL